MADSEVALADERHAGNLPSTIRGRRRWPDKGVSLEAFRPLLSLRVVLGLEVMNRTTSTRLESQSNSCFLSTSLRSCASDGAAGRFARFDVQTLQERAWVDCMTLTLNRVGRLVGVLARERGKVRSRQGYLAGLLILASCAQSPAVEPVQDPSKGAGEQIDGGSFENSGQPMPTTQGGTAADGGGSSRNADGSASSTGEAGGPSIGADGGAGGGGGKDASIGMTQTSGGAIGTGSAAPSGDGNTEDSGAAAIGSIANEAGAGSSGGTIKDSGAPSGGAATTTPTSGGTAHYCASTPSYPTADVCARCICAKCGSQIAACYASGDASKDMLCGQVQTCAETKRCTGSNCYCGNSLLCLAPNGGCVDIIQSVVGSTNPTDVQNASNDISTALGRANATGTCSQSSCKSECGL